MVKYTFNFTDKSILTSLSLFFNSGLLFTVPPFFSYSTCLLYVMSSVILLCFCSIHHVALLLFSFCTVPSLFTISLLIFFFLLLTHFSFRMNNPIRFLIHFPLYPYSHNDSTSPFNGRANDICLGN
jgi:hypothetical protein